MLKTLDHKFGWHKVRGVGMNKGWETATQSGRSVNGNHEFMTRPGDSHQLASARPARRARPPKASRRVTTAGLTFLVVAWTAAGPLLHADGPSKNGRAAIPSSIAGNLTVVGTNGKPVALGGLRVELYGPRPSSQLSATKTDAQGHYQFKLLQPGSYRVQVGASGFKPFADTLALEPGELHVENIHLELESVIQKVTVRDHTSAVSAQAADPPAKFSTPQFVALPLAQQKFEEALPLVPGVVRTPDGELDIKGSAEDQGMLLVDSAQTVDPVTGRLAIDIPIDEVQTLSVNENPDSAEYGGFSGGLSTVETKPPSGEWTHTLMDFVPGIRGKNGQIVGISSFTPRLVFGGPLLQNKLNFSEDFAYDVRNIPVRGLAWPNNETQTQGFNSFTTLQAVLSPKHVLAATLDFFPLRTRFADINSLVPQTASSNYGQKGVAMGINDDYQFSSGVLLTTMIRYMRFDSNAYAQGPAEMLVTPDGWRGNFFNGWNRTSNQLEALPVLQWPDKRWLGRHDLKVGADFLYRSYNQETSSRPIQILRQDGSLAERIDFQGSGQLSDSDTEVGGFVQDHWTITDHLGIDAGSRLTSQSIGRSAVLEPRGGLVYAPGRNARTVIRVGAGLFYDRVPLLAADFPEDPTRVVTSFDQAGALSGPPLAFRNAYLREGNGAGNVSFGGEPNSSPRNFTTNIEIDREITRKVMIRVAYLYSHTQNLFVVDPLTDTAKVGPVLGLANNGGSHYHQFEATLHYQASSQTEFNLSYVRSRTRGDLNTLSSLFVPFDQPVIRPDAVGNLQSDIPNRVVGWGMFKLPWKLTFSPVVDVHTGFPYSEFDTLQNYVGVPDGERFPTFFSLDVKVYREVTLPLPFLGHRVFRLGVYSINVTNHSNPHDVYSNVASPYFGDFEGFYHRVDGLVIDVVK
jgi:Carboxypeptidase regulatory-like domain